MDVERPTEAELARLQAAYGQPRMRSFHWDHRGEAFERDYPECQGEAVLLVHDPAKGLLVARPAEAPPDTWVIPMGRVWASESFEAGARREALEETGIEIRIREIPAIHVCTLLFQNTRLERWYFICLADAVGGILEPQAPEEMVESRFESDYMALRGWRQSEWYCSILKDGRLL